MAQNILSMENAFKKLKFFHMKLCGENGKNGKVSDFRLGIVVKKFFIRVCTKSMSRNIVYFEYVPATSTKNIF